MGSLRLRMIANAMRPRPTATPKKSSRNPSTGLRPISGIAKVSVNRCPNASTIVKNRTMKPQNTKKWAMPGTFHLSSRTWPKTSVTWPSRRFGQLSSRPGEGWPEAIIRVSTTTRRPAMASATNVMSRPPTSRTIMWVSTETSSTGGAQGTPRQRERTAPAGPVPTDG